MRDCIRSRNYRMTERAQEEAWEEEITAVQVEQAILHGTILETQRDAETGESKYLVRSRDIPDRTIEVVAKLGPTGRLYVITVYSIES